MLESLAVAVSGDGRTAILGDPYNTVDLKGTAGVAYVFTRKGNGWIRSPKKLTLGPTAKAGDMFGSSVALSANGNTALVGAPNTYNTQYAGAAYVFQRVSGVWGPPQKLSAVLDPNKPTELVRQGSQFEL
jgi:hypothetical protein